MSVKDWDRQFTDADDAPVLESRPLRDDTEMDITPMIDCTFLLLIFFLVCSTQAAQSGITLAPARYGTSVSNEDSVMLTVADSGDPKRPEVYVGDGRKGNPLPEDHEQQAAAIEQAVNVAFSQGKLQVMVKAEKAIHFREVTRICAAATQREGVNLYLAVDEADEE